MIWAAIAAAAAGYALGRLRPYRSALDWARWQRYGARTGRRDALVQAVLYADQLTQQARHPVRAWRAWQHRNTPTRPRHDRETV
ncbi:hypothetical protein ACFC08_28730 [Streptomyces sp. NPDC056112]|uniref:hypothetical protein n=1 Tax=Streptomyces sp. NPDC056112 TaxID=3345715 RepID=UPI0035D8264F